MSRELASSAPTAAAAYADRARAYAEAAHASNTRRAYGRDMLAFTAWCEARGACALPAPSAEVLVYLMDHANTLRVTTLQRHFASIRAAHEAACPLLDKPSPVFRKARRGLKREHGRPVENKRFDTTSGYIQAGQLFKCNAAGMAGL